MCTDAKAGATSITHPPPPPRSQHPNATPAKLSSRPSAICLQSASVHPPRVIAKSSQLALDHLARIGLPLPAPPPLSHHQGVHSLVNGTLFTTLLLPPPPPTIPTVVLCVCAATPENKQTNEHNGHRRKRESERARETSHLLLSAPVVPTRPTIFFCLQQLAFPTPRSWQSNCVVRSSSYCSPLSSPLPLPLPHTSSDSSLPPSHHFILRSPLIACTTTTRFQPLAVYCYRFPPLSVLWYTN